MGACYAGEGRILTSTAATAASLDFVGRLSCGRRKRLPLARGEKGCLLSTAVGRRLRIQRVHEHGRDGNQNGKYGEGAPDAQSQICSNAGAKKRHFWTISGTLYRAINTGD